MISYVEGSIFESPAETLVNTVNTSGVMGRGLAADFKRLYPEMFEQYRALCEAKRIDIGTLWMYRTEHKSVLNFPTKSDWRKPSRLEYIEAGLRSLLKGYDAAGITSIAVPALGCGNGGLSFDDVRPLMEKYLRRMAATVYIYPPQTTIVPEHRKIAEMSHWLRTAPEELSFAEVWSDLRNYFAKRRTLKTFSKETPFSAEMAEDSEAIRVRTESRVALLKHADVLEVWKNLRDFGIVSGRSAMSYNPRMMSYLGPILAQLSYVRAVKVAGGYFGTDTFEREAEIALQLVPRSSTRNGSDQFELLSGSKP